MRHATSADADAIMRAFNDTFALSRDAGYWRWKFVQSAAPTSIIAVDPAGNVLSQFAAAPTRYWATVGGELAGGLGADVFAVRKANAIQSRLFIKAVRLFYSHRGFLSQYAFTLGFPNVVAYQIYLHTIKFRYDCPLAQFSRPLTDDTSRSRYKRRALGENEITEFWHRIQSKYSFCIIKDGAWCRWRFREHPVFAYELVGLWDNNGVLRGWAALRQVGTTLVVVDMTVDPDDARSIDGLDDLVAAHGFALGCDAALAIVPEWFAPAISQRSGPWGHLGNLLGGTRTRWTRVEGGEDIRFVLVDHATANFDIGTRPWISFADTDLY